MLSSSSILKMSAWQSYSSVNGAGLAFRIYRKEFAIIWFRSGVGVTYPVQGSRTIGGAISIRYDPKHGAIYFLFATAGVDGVCVLLRFWTIRDVELLWAHFID